MRALEELNGRFPVREFLASDSADRNPELNVVCRTAARLFNVPIAFTTLMDASTVWLKGRYGLSTTSMPRLSAFCDRTAALLVDQALIVPDLAADDLYARSSLVMSEPFARFYAGVPLAIRDGSSIGTFCVMDRVPRSDFGAAEVAELQGLARSVETIWNLRASDLSGHIESQRRQRAEELLAIRDQALSKVGQAQRIAEMTASFGHWRIDARTRTIMWSEGVSRIYGRVMPPSGVLDIDEHLRFYHPDDRQLMRRRIRDALAGRRLRHDHSYRARGRIRRPQGEVRNIAIQALVERDADGSVISIQGITLDVTELTRSERIAEQTADMLRTTLEHIDQGLVMIGADERVRVFNDRARDLLKLPVAMLHEGADYRAIRRHVLASGTLSADPLFVDGDAATHTILVQSPERRERERDDGSIIEVRAMPLPDGGIVRTFADVTQRRRSEQAVRESERRFRLLAEKTTDVIIWSDLDTTRRYVSPAAKTVLGYDPEELVGTKPLDFVHPKDAEHYRTILDDLCQGRTESVTTTKRYRRKDGIYVCIEVSFSLTREAPEGPITGYVASLRDVTERKKIEEDLRLSEERLSMALDSGSDGLWDLNVVTGELALTGEWLTILGYADGDVASNLSAWEPRTHPDDLLRAKTLLAKHYKDQTSKYECEYRVRAKDGSYVWTLSRGKVVARDVSGRALRMVGTHIDITRRKEAEALIAHMALHDALTGLPNRVLFQDRLDQEVGNLERNASIFAVLACDLDRFKVVNDTLGHSAGDSLLQTVAERLSLIVRDGDTVARLGGDEFAIILRHVDGAREASIVARRIITAIEEPVKIAGRSASVGISVGIAIGAADVGSPSLNADALLRNADIALYRAKADGRNTYRFFEPGMDEAVAARNTLEHDLRDAVKQKSLVLHYQPIVDVADRQICGFEALMRWEHPTRGRISPAEFIPIAEEAGLIVSMGDWALSEACQQAILWPKHLRVAVNVSVMQFQRPEALKRSVETALDNSGLAPNRLELEITESVLVQDAEAVIACLHDLRAVGTRIALDDFGTGYSSLAYLRQFPFDKIKIDQTFVSAIADPDTAAIVRAVVGLGTRVGADMTAEGVETSEQLALIQEVGCTQVQGFLFGKPLPIAGAMALLTPSDDPFEA